jgi:hypothetical protein
VTDNQILLLVVVGGLIIGVALLYGLLMVWPLALVLVVAGYLGWGTMGVVGGLIVAGIFGLLVVLLVMVSN